MTDLSDEILAKLKGISGGAKDHSIFGRTPSFSIGRGANCNLTISNSGLSEIYCEIIASCEESTGKVEIFLKNLSPFGTCVDESVVRKKTIDSATLIDYRNLT